jgi:hypothetical protein
MVEPTIAGSQFDPQSASAYTGLERYVACTEASNATRTLIKTSAIPIMMDGSLAWGSLGVICLGMNPAVDLLHARRPSSPV